MSASGGSSSGSSAGGGISALPTPLLTAVAGSVGGEERLTVRTGFLSGLTTSVRMIVGAIIVTL